MRYLDRYGTLIIGGAGSIYAYVSGNYGQASIILMAIMVLDVISGLMKAYENRNIRSDRMSLGLMKKGGILLAVVFAGLLDKLVSNGEPIFVNMMVWLSIGNESMSFIENLTILGVNIPDEITSRLGQIRELRDNKEDKGEE